MLKKFSSYIVVLAIGAVIGTYFDAKHTIEEKIVIKDRVKTEIREIITERPDGTKVTERVTHKDEKTKSVANKKESIPASKNWGVGVKYDLFTSDVPVFTIEVQRRIFSSFYAGAYGRTDGVVGVGVTVLF